MPARKKIRKVTKDNAEQKGYAGTSVLYLVILTGALLIGFMFAGSSVPQQTVKPTVKEIVTVMPHQEGDAQPNIQMSTFGGVTGLPTAIPTKRPTPTGVPSPTALPTP